MAKIDLNATYNFRDIFDQLPDYEKFIIYLRSQTIVTEEMRNKQILRLSDDSFFSSSSNDDQLIVKMAPNETQYLDRKFWSDGMQE